MGVKACTALSGSESWARRGLLTALCVLLLVSLVYSAPVPDNDDSLTGNNDLASGEATDVKTNLDDGFDDLVGVQSVDDAKAKETEVIYRTQTQGITLPHFKFTTGPTTLPPIPKITTFHPIPIETTARPDEQELHIDIQGVMTRPAGSGVFTTAHVPEPIVEIETTQTTVSTTTTVAESTTAEEAVGGILVDVDVDTKEEETESTSSSTTTTTTTSPPTTTTVVDITEAAVDAILVGGEKAEELEPIDELLETNTSTTTTTTTTSPPTTTTTEETTEAAGGAILVGGEKAEELEPIDELLETNTSTTTTTTTASPPTTTTTEETTEAAGGAILVGGEKAEEESTTTTKPTTQTTTPVMVVIVDGGDDEEPSSTTTTTTTTTTTEPTTEAEKPIGIIDVKEKTINDDVKYTTPTTTVLAYTTKQPTEKPSTTTTATPTEVVPIAKVELSEAKEKGNETDDEELQKIVVSIEVEPTVVVDPEDGDVNGTMIGESTQEGLSSGARTGIAIACIVGFWIILGPLVCLICKMRDKKRDKKEQEERNAREKASNHLVEEMVKAELQKQPNGDHKKNGDYKKAQYKDETPVDESEFEPITIGRSDSVPYIDDDADSRDTEL